MDQVTFDAQGLIQCTPPPPQDDERERSDSVVTVAYCTKCPETVDDCVCVNFADVTPLSKYGISYLPPYTNLWCRACNVVGACMCEHPDPSQQVPLLPVPFPFKMPLNARRTHPHPYYQYVHDCLVAGLLSEYKLGWTVEPWERERATMFC